MEKRNDAPRKQLTLSTEVGYYTYGRHRSLQNLPKSNDSLFLRYAGEEWCEPGYYFDLPRTEYHLHIVLEGRGVFCTKGQRYPLGPGDIFLVSKGEENYYQADQEDPWHYIWVACGGSNAWPLLQKAGFSSQCPTRKVNAPIEQFVRLVYEIMKYPKLTYVHTLRRMSLLYEILALLIASQHPQTMQGSHMYVQQAIHYVQQNYAACTVEEMAEYVGITRNYLFTLFKQQLAQSPQQYIIQCRMEKAASLLANTQRRISDIASTVGYEDPLSFAKAFKRAYQISPLGYRKSVQK